MARESLAVGRPWLRRVSWGALFAGFFVGFGIWLLLLALGAGVGLATFNPKDVGNWQGLGIGFGLWGVVAGIVAMFVAGWLTARLSASEERTEGTLHGIALWGFMVVAGLWIATMAVTRTVSGAASAVGGAAQTAAQAGSQDPQARREAHQQADRLGGQAQQQAQAAKQELQQNKDQIAETAATAGSAGAWAFFIFGVLTLAAAALGGRAGVPRLHRTPPEAEPAPLPDRPLSPQRV
jgi:vacuolar-type H+-ATPase subunit H